MNGHGPARWSGPGKKSVRALETHRAPEPVEVPNVSDVDATDAAKALAAEHHVDLSTITGTGADGRITKDDVTAAIESAGVASLLEHDGEEPDVADAEETDGD